MRSPSRSSRRRRARRSRSSLPLAHRLGIHAIKWELEDLAFATLHPRKYDEIKELVAQQRAERERYVEEAGAFLAKELGKVGIEAEISGRAKHFYSIYTKMTRKGREFNEIFDLTAMRVLVGSVKDCYGAIGIVHSLWKPLPGRFKDFVAMPKANAYQALHTTVIGPEGRPLEIQIRTPDMHELAEYGIAAHVIYKEGSSSAEPGKEKMTWLRQLLENEEHQGPQAFLEALKVDLFEDEVFVFTPKGEVKNLAAGSTPLDFAYSIHTDVGPPLRRLEGERQDRAAPLPAAQRRHRRGAHRQAGPRALTRLAQARSHEPRAQQDPRLVLARGPRGRRAQGREQLAQAFKKQGLPYPKLAGSPLLVDVIREMGFRKADDFYIALGQSKISTKVVTNKVMQRLKRGEAVEEEPAEGLIKGTDDARRRTREATDFGIKVKGIEDVVVRLAKCCRPVPGDEIVGYVSLGRGITVHREDCRNVAALKKAPERFTEVYWDGDNESSYRVELQVDAWDRTRLLEDLSRTFAEAGLNILEARCTTKHPMVKNRFVLEVGDTEQLKQCISRLRNVDWRVRRLPGHAHSLSRAIPAGESRV